MPSSDNAKAAVTLYTTTDMPVEDIGRQFGVSRQSVHNWLRAAGVPPRGPRGPRRIHLPPDEALTGEVLRQLAEIRSALTRLEAVAAHLQGALDTLVKLTSKQ